MDIEKIAMQAERFVGRANRTFINKKFMENDESHLYPIFNKFNATKRAISHLQTFMRLSGNDLTGYAYAVALDAQITHIVNAAI